MAVPFVMVLRYGELKTEIMDLVRHNKLEAVSSEPSGDREDLRCLYSSSSVYPRLQMWLEAQGPKEGYCVARRSRDTDLD